MLKKLQTQADEYIAQYGYFDVLTNMALLTEEVGEVARVIARTYGQQSSKSTDNQDLGEELSDVIFVCLCIANQTGIDLQQSFDLKMKKNRARDHQRHLDNHKIIK